MRNRNSMRAVAEGIDAMAREESAYWLGMAMRCLLVEPRYFR
jgi:hypothetical protein